MRRQWQLKCIGIVVCNEFRSYGLPTIPYVISLTPKYTRIDTKKNNKRTHYFQSSIRIKKKIAYIV